MTPTGKWVSDERPHAILDRVVAYPPGEHWSGNTVIVAVFAGFALGKPIGVFLFSWLAVRTGIATRPPDLDWMLLIGGSMLAGIGFTMALFIANIAFSASLINDAKPGILSASVFSAVAGIVLMPGWSVRRKHRETANGS